MASNFDNVAHDWDANKIRHELAENVFQEINKNVTFNHTIQVLDYGTGTGLILTRIQPLAASITGMDNSQGMLDVLKEKVDHLAIKNVQLIKHNIDSEEIGINMFDVVVSSMTMHHITDTKDFLTKVFNALKPNGNMCIADLVEEDGTFHKAEDTSVKHLGFNLEKLEILLDSIGFKSIKVYPFYNLLKPTEPGEKTFPIFMAVARKM